MSWETQPFADVVKDVTGGNLKTKKNEYEESGAYPIVDQGQTLVGGFTDDKDKVCKAELPVIIFGDHTKTFKFIDFPFCLGADGTKVLRPKNGADPKYLFYALQTAHIPDAGYSRHFKFLKESKIPLPPLEEQKRIAAILDQADALRRLRQRTIDRLNTLGQAIFHEMFGSPIANQRGWETKTLKDLSTRICSGSTPKGGKKVYVDDGVVFLRSQNVWRREIKLDDVVYIDEATHERMGKTSLKKGDILITKTGRINTENSSLGRAALFSGEDGSANINGHVYLIRTKTEVEERFVEYILAMPEYREYIRNVCVGGIDKRQINKEHLDEFPIINPSAQTQRLFLRRLSEVEGQRKKALAQLRLCESLFFSLQHRAFRGEL